MCNSGTEAVNWMIELGQSIARESGVLSVSLSACVPLPEVSTFHSAPGSERPEYLLLIVSRI